MKYILALFIFLSYTAMAQDLSLYSKKEFTSPEGKKLPYRILLPDNYEPSKKYPLVLVLHGAGERGNDNEKQLVHGGKLFLDSVNRKEFPAIVVFPQCPAESFWSSVAIDRGKTPVEFDFDYTRAATDPLTITMMLLDELIRNEAVDTRRIYITGLSMGGMGTFEAVHRHPDIFAAALPICGGGDIERYQKVKTPFWVFHGTDDTVVDVRNSRDMVDRLKGVGVKVKYTEYPGVKHNSWENAFGEEKFLKWMFRKKL